MKKRAQNVVTKPKKAPLRKAKGQVKTKAPKPKVGSASAFMVALADPFSPRAVGAHVPDPYPFPTTTYHVHQTTTLKSPTSLTGSGGVLLLPSVTYSMIDSNYAGSLIASQSVIGTTPMNQIGNYNPYNYGAVADTDVFSKFGTFRVVGWGVKISNLQPELSATGRVIVAHVPISDEVPDYGTLATAATATSPGWITAITGIRPDILTSGSLIEMPDAVEFAVQDLLHGDIEISGRYTNSSFWNFKSAARSSYMGSNVYLTDSSSVSTLTGLTQTSGLKDLTRCQGAAGIAIYFEGMPVTAGNINLQVETIYHLEGSPTLGGTTNTALISASSGTTVLGTMNDVEKAMIKASLPEVAFKFVTKGAQFLNNNKAIIKGIASLAL